MTRYKPLVRPDLVAQPSRQPHRGPGCAVVPTAGAMPGSGQVPQAVRANGGKEGLQ
ncbi:MAG: hypothetical protein ACTHJW_22415 [Streptosporangiaceae bacterium]